MRPGPTGTRSEAIVVDDGIGDMKRGGDAIRRRKMDAPAGASRVAVNDAIFHVQGGAVGESDAGAADSRSAKGHIAQPHHNACAIDNDNKLRMSPERSAAVDRDRL